jgi:hypothetical protein
MQIMGVAEKRPCVVGQKLSRWFLLGPWEPEGVMDWPSPTNFSRRLEIQ